MKKKTKKRPTDLTLRNLRAMKKWIDYLMDRVNDLITEDMNISGRLRLLTNRVDKLEQAKKKKQ